MSEETIYDLKLVVEGALLAAGKPLTVEKLAQLFDDETRPANEAIRAVLQQIEQECEGRAYELKLVASGYRFQVRQNLSGWVNRLWEEKPQRYSRAMLETLALIAYRQPITRGEIEEIRGVSVSSNIVRTMQERDWVRVVGHRDVPGRPAMFATTREFLDYFNLKNLDELPVLSEICDLEKIGKELDLAPLSVGSTGEAESAVESQSTEADGDQEEPLSYDDAPGSEVAAMFEGGPQEELEEDEALFLELDEMEKSLPTNFRDMLKSGIDAGNAPADESVEELEPELAEASSSDVVDFSSDTPVEKSPGNTPD